MWGLSWRLDRDQLRLDEQIGIGLSGPTRCILDAFLVRLAPGRTRTTTRMPASSYSRK